MKKLLFVLSLGAISTLTTNAQILLSGGLTYNQNFDSLSNTPAASSGTWTDNATPGLTGWYAARSFITTATTAPSGGVYGPYAYSTYRVGDGSANNGSVWSFGTIGNTDRAFGSLGSGTVRTNAYGVLFQNDTLNAVDTLTIGYTGEQWRNGGNTAAQALAFSYQIFTTPFSGPVSDANAGWTTFGSLNFVSPITGATAATLDGNLSANRTVIAPIVLTGVTLNPGEQIFLRWQDLDDSGNDHGLALDDLSVSFSSVVPEPATATLGGLAALAVVFYRRCRN